MKNLQDLNFEAPRSLDDAINSAVCIYPAKDGIKKIRENVLDYIHEKFESAYLKADSQEEHDRLESLYLQLTRSSDE